MKPEIPESIQALWVKATDGLLTSQEQVRLDEFLKTQPELRKELEMDMSIKASTDALTQRILAGAQIEPPRPGAATQAMFGLGFVGIFAGLCLLLGFGVHALMTDPEVPIWVQLGVALSGTGTAILFVHALRVRARAMGRDPYEEVDR